MSDIDFRPAFKIIRILMLGVSRDSFQNSRTPEGKSWPPLKNARRRPRDKRKGRKGKDKPLLDTGLLRASVTTPQGKDHVDKETPTTLVIGSNLFYAGFHQFGTRTIPVRKYLGWNRELIERTKVVVRDHAIKVLRSRR